MEGGLMRFFYVGDEFKNDAVWTLIVAVLIFCCEKV